jgi:signal transduction histidine kinase
MASPLIRVPLERLGRASSATADPANQTHLASGFVDFLPCVLYECDFSLEITYVSPNASELINVESTRLIGTRAFWEERIFREDFALLSEKLNDLETAGSISFIHRIIDDSGLPVWIAHSLRKVPSEAKEIIRGCVIPLRGEKRVQDLDDGIISRFIHKIGNHFQLLNLVLNPLRKVLPESRETEVLQQTVEKAIELTRSFSDYSQGPTWLSEIDLSEVLNGAICTRKASFVRKGIGFHVAVDDSVQGATIKGDPFLLESAIGSILQNALEATEKGGRVLFSAKLEKRDSNHPAVIKIDIEDTGCGIQQDELSKITVPFFTSKKNQDGLGLSMASRFVELHGGVLKVDSQKGKGTKVSITLPTVVARCPLDH